LSVVIDANLLVALALDARRGKQVEKHLREWKAAGETLHSPALMPYEIASALTRVFAAGALDAQQVTVAWNKITAVPVKLHGLADGPGVVALAQQLQRHSAYDAAYIALAQQLDADLWTLDGPLARNAAAHGLPVRSVESG
jgi:predicted nucleic acid-binding protein